MGAPEDYTFTANRRGETVVIRGTVLAPPGSVPYLLKSFETSRGTRTFRLAFHENNNAVPHQPQSFEHFEPNVPSQVNTLRILLPNEKVFVIAHGRPGRIVD
jgi:hypothetical protein